MTKKAEPNAETQTEIKPQASFKRLLPSLAEKGLRALDFFIERMEADKAAKPPELTSAGLEIGRAYVLFVPPGWHLVGTVAGERGIFTMFDNIIYSERVNTGHALVSSLGNAKSRRDVTAAIERFWAMPNGVLVISEAILFATPMEDGVDVAHLARAMHAKAIEEA